MDNKGKTRLSRSEVITKVLEEMIENIEWKAEIVVEEKEVDEVECSDGRVGGQSFLYTWLHCECCG